MPFFKSMRENAGPPKLFVTYPDLYLPWSEMSQAMMNGPSPLSQAERELILALAAGAAGCEFVYVAHSEVAYAWGIEEGLLDKLLDDIDAAPVSEKLRPLLKFVKKLAVTPAEMTQADADAVFDAGWDEHALHDAIAVTARAAFMQRLTQGAGFVPMDRETARKHAHTRVEKGYVNLYPAFAKTESKD
jgi:uncharacterized peroxidase-related enzyme